MALWGVFVTSITVTPSMGGNLYTLSENTLSQHHGILSVQLGKVKVQGFGLMQPEPFHAWDIKPFLCVSSLPLSQTLELLQVFHLNRFVSSP